MNTQQTEPTTYSDRIKLALNFDPQKLKSECTAMNLPPFEYYDVVPLRAPAHMIDSSLPLPPPADDYADGSWTDWLDAPELVKSPYLTEVISTFKKHTKVTLVRLLRLAPGSVVQEHTDPTLGIEIHKSVVRFTIPILNGEGVEFFLNGTTVNMNPGECWYLRLTDPHKINNPGGMERINLTIDMIPNEWVFNLIKQGNLVVN